MQKLQWEEKQDSCIRAMPALGGNKELTQERNLSKGNPETRRKQMIWLFALVTWLLGTCIISSHLSQIGGKESQGYFCNAYSFFASFFQ